VPDADSDGSDVVKTLAGLVGLAAGAVALVYAAGGGVLALRLYLTHLPSLAVVGQLPRAVLVSIGLAQIVLPTAAVVALYAAYRVLSGATAPPTRLVSQWKPRSRRGWLELVAASAVPAAAVTLIVRLKAGNHMGEVRGGAKGWEWLLPLAFAITLLAVLLGLNLRARLVTKYGESADSWHAARPVVYMSLVVALVVAPICFLFAGTLIKLRQVKVCTTNGRHVAGVLIGETGDRTYVGKEESSKGSLQGIIKRPSPNVPHPVVSIPRSEIILTIIGSYTPVKEGCPPPP
jgi:hypothetical protein